MHIQIISFLETKVLNLKEMLGNLSQMYPRGDGNGLLDVNMPRISTDPGQEVVLANFRFLSSPHALRTLEPEKPLSWRAARPGEGLG